MTKYNARKVELDGHVFDSQAEARRYQALKLLERNGDISNLTVHPRFCIAPAYIYRGERVLSAWYEADFQYYDNGIVVEDVKGKETALFRLKWKLVRRLYPQYDWRIISAKDC